MPSVRRLAAILAADAAGLVEHELEPWEKRCHALADVLEFHKIINTEEKRRGVDALGSELIVRLSYYKRWIVAFAHILFQKMILIPEELARKMDEVAARPAAAAARTEANSPQRPRLLAA
jgi:Nitrile hydratase beta subunit